MNIREAVVAASLMVALVPTPVKAQSNTFFQERNGNWTLHGEVIRSDDLNYEGCFISTFWEKKAHFGFQYDLIDKSSALVYTNLDFQFAKANDTVILTAFGGDFPKDGFKITYNYKVIDSTTIRIPNLDGDDVLLGFSKADKISITFPGSLPTVNMNMKGFSLSAAHFSQCISKWGRTFARPINR